MKTECNFGKEWSQVLMIYYIYNITIPYILICSFVSINNFQAKQLILPKQVPFYLW